MAKKYAWIEFVDEVGHYILNNFKDNHKGLVETLKKIEELFDYHRERKKTLERLISVDDIDPFSFLSPIYSYNTWEQRKKLCDLLKMEWNLNTSPEIEDLDFAPSIHGWWVCGKGTPKHEIDILWKLFEEVVKRNVTEVTFNEALKIKGLNISTIAMALTWVDPANYLIPGKQTINKGFSDKVKKITNWQEYQKYIAHIRSQHPDMHFIDIMRAGYCNDVVVKNKKTVKSNNKLSLNTILYGPPGTGKTYNTINMAVAICDAVSMDKIKEERAKNDGRILARFNELRDAKRIMFTTFHQSVSYEDFVEGLKPQAPEEKGAPVTYKVVNGIFKDICKVAEKSDAPHVLIIDEINRGNVSAVLGELITLLEDDKRIDRTSELRVTLPYSKQHDFGVPSNLYVIGTMNTADRSVEALDTALRRRFSFIEMFPDPELLKSNTFDGIDLSKMLEAINRRLELLIGRDNMIGHAFFMNIGDINSLRMIFKDKIIPQLQEYFYGDWEKINLILGDSFVRREDASHLASFEKSSGINEDELREIWKITDHNKWSEDDFSNIYNIQQQ